MQRTCTCTRLRGDRISEMSAKKPGPASAPAVAGGGGRGGGGGSFLGVDALATAGGAPAASEADGKRLQSCADARGPMA